MTAEPAGLSGNPAAAGTAARRPERVTSDGPYALALLLAALAGWVDAAGVSGSGGLFVSFMSGDTTQGAIAAAHQDWTRFGQIGAVIASFVAGIIAGELVDTLCGRFGPTAVLLLQAGCLAFVAWIPHVSVTLPFLALPCWGKTCCLAFAMGLQNATMHRSAGMNIGLTYITGTLVQFGRSIAAGLRGTPAWGRAARHLGLWVSLAAGACGSAVVLASSRFASLAAAAVAAALLGLACLALRLRAD